LAFNQAWFADVRGWVDPRFYQDALLQGSLAGAGWVHLVVTTTVWLGLPLLVAATTVVRSEVE